MFKIILFENAYSIYYTTTPTLVFIGVMHGFIFYFLGTVHNKLLMYVYLLE